MLALLAVAATPLDASTVAGATPYRTEHYDLADICTNGLPWTNHPTPRLPPWKPRDRHDVPMYRVAGRLYYRPGAIAINGMKHIDAYRDDGDELHLAMALKEASRLRIMSLTRRHADWVPYLYDYYTPAGQRAPWFDAMTQGLTLSFYVRLWHVTGRETHLDAARDVFRSFQRLGQRHRPWVSSVDGNGYLWFVHYPRRWPDYILNAHLHAIFGIYEYWQATRSSAARSVLMGGITTMRRHAWRYRRPGGVSLYGLTSRTRIYKYHEIHIWQLRLLAKISGRQDFLRLSRALARDVPQVGRVNGRPAGQGKRMAGPHCHPGFPRASNAPGPMHVGAS